MTHDPLCAWWSIQCDSECAELPYRSSCKHMFCVCDLIAKVEARTEDRMYKEWRDADAYRESGLTT